jgi:anti-anti-sigma regulatory factor
MSAWLRVEAPAAVEDDVDLEAARVILAEGLDVVIDMYMTDVITSAGCRAMQRLHERAGQLGRRIVVIGANGVVLEVMLITDLIHQVDVVDDATRRIHPWLRTPR